MKIFVATPVHSNHIDYRYMVSLINSFGFFSKLGIPVTLRFLQGSLINRSRNELVSLFLEDTTNTHLLFIDSDIFDFDKGCLQRIVSYDRDVVGGVYRHFFSCITHRRPKLFRQLFCSIVIVLDQKDIRTP